MRCRKWDPEMKSPMQRQIPHSMVLNEFTSPDPRLRNIRYSLGLSGAPSPAGRTPNFTMGSRTRLWLVSSPASTPTTHPPAEWPKEDVNERWPWTVLWRSWLLRLTGSRREWSPGQGRKWRLLDRKKGSQIEIYEGLDSKNLFTSHVVTLPKSNSWNTWPISSDQP